MIIYIVVFNSNNNNRKKKQRKRNSENVSHKLRGKQLSAMHEDRLPDGQDRAAQGLHLLPQRLLQMRRVLDEADTQDLLQQSGQDQNKLRHYY